MGGIGPKDAAPARGERARLVDVDGGVALQAVRLALVPEQPGEAERRERVHLGADAKVVKR